MSLDFPYRTRRTIKPNQMDSTRPVPREVCEEVLTDAHWAPTHGLTQPWRFHVFVDAARARLAAILESVYDSTTPDAEKREEKRSKLRAGVMAAPVAIVVAVRVEPGGRISELDEIAAAACAVQNLMLSAHQRGLGSFWSSAPATCAPELLRELGMDGTHRGLGVVFLGYPAAGAQAVSARAPLAERVTIYME